MANGAQFGNTTAAPVTRNRGNREGKDFQKNNLNS